MKSILKYGSIIGVFVLLLAMAGVVPAAAKGRDASGLGVSRASLSPQAVTVAEDTVEWAAANGDDITYVRPNTYGVFFLKDDVLETTASGTATWTTLAADSTDFNIAGTGTGTPTATTFARSADFYDATTPANTPITALADLTVTVGGQARAILGSNLNAGTFTLSAAAATGTTVVASFKYHLRDTYTPGTTTASKRAKVTGTSDPAGEFVKIWEVTGVTARTAVTNENVTSQITGDAGASTRRTFTVANLPIADADGDGDVDSSDITITATGFTQSTATITINAETGVVTTNADLNTTSTTVSYSHYAASPTARVFVGVVSLTSDAAKAGSNSDGIWVQDGDTLTVTYYKSDGTALDSDTVKVDGVLPAIAAVSPADGTITNVPNPQISFEVTDTGAGMLGDGTAIDITINGTDVSDQSLIFQPVADGFRVIFATGTSWVTAFSVADSTAFQWRIKARDKAGNEKVLQTTALDLTIDLTKPVVASAVTGTGWNSETAAEATSTTSVKVVFSEIVDATTVDASDFTVDGVAPSAVIVGTTSDPDRRMNAYLTVSGLAVDAKPEVKLVTTTGVVQDKAGNAVDVTSTSTTNKVTSTDGIKPTLSSITISQNLAIKDDKPKVTVEVNEKVASSGGMIVSVNGPAGADINGLISTTAPTPTQHEGTKTILTGTATGKYGVSIQAKDLGNNTKDNLTTVTDELVAASKISTTTITLLNGPIADRDFDGDVDTADITASGITGGITITAVNASARTLTTSASVTGQTAIKVTYKYPYNATTKTYYTFEVDQSSPSVTFDPADAGSVETTSPIIRVVFNDDEYPGDSYKTVELTKAELTKPDATTENVLSKFSSADSIEYIYAASGLALGEYTLKVSGKDVAGNKLTDSSAKFTVKERSKFELTLRPGWNLVSFPGTIGAAAADREVSAVFANTDVEAVVTYDPSSAEVWPTAVKDPTTGQLVGSLTEIKADRGYWVKTTSTRKAKVLIPILEGGQVALPPAISVAEGWNLVPVLDITGAKKAGDVIGKAEQYLGSVTAKRVLWYNDTTKVWETIIVGTTSTPGSDVKVGWGLWVFASKGTLVPGTFQ